jgi:WD40 repeat protein
MSNRLSVRIGTLIIVAALGAWTAPAQDHVRLVPQLGADNVTSVAFSPDGRLVLTGSLYKNARLWDKATGQEIRTFTGHSSGVTSVAFSPDGLFALTGSVDKTARLWDLATGQQIRIFAGHGSIVNSVAFSPNGRFVLTGSGSPGDSSGDNTARLWDANTGQQIRTFAGHTKAVVSVVFSPDGQFVLTAGDTTARLWNVNTGQQIRIFAGHTGAVNSAAFSPDGGVVLTGSWDKTARLWDVATGHQTRSFNADEIAVHAVAFSPNGRSVLTAGMIGTARLWDAATGRQILSFKTKDLESSVAFSPDGRSVLTNLDDAAVLYDAVTGQHIRTFTGHTSGDASLAFSPDGRFLLTGGRDNTARLWDMTTGQQIREFDGHTGAINSAAISADGLFALTGSSDNTARLWDIATGRQIRQFAGHTSEVNSVAFSPDGHLLLTGSDDRTARLWDVNTGRQIREFGVYTSFVESVAFSPDGRFMLTGSSDETARLWDSATGKQIRTFAGHTAAFSPDGRFVLTGSASSAGNTEDNTAQLWDTSTGKHIQTFTGHTDTIYSVAFSPDGHFVLTGSHDKTARIWDAATGQQIRSFLAPAGWRGQTAFSPDGRFVLRADETTCLWDAASGTQLATLLSFDHSGWAVTDREGRYDSNDPANTPGLAWVTDSNRVIELTELKDNYYTPNLLARVIKVERMPEVKGLDTVPAPPEVSIASSYNQQSHSVALSITNQGGGVGRLVVSVNDRQVAVLEHPVNERAAARTSTAGTEVTVNLAAATIKPGENTMSAYAFDAGNQIRSHEVTAKFIVARQSKGIAPEATEETTPAYIPQFYAIVVGTSHFANHSMDLLYPAHDAESMMTGLEIGAARLFGAENLHMHLLTSDAKEENGQPTKKNISAVFADVRKNAKSTDVLLVYLSGHGVNLHAEKDSYYYLTADARSLDIENNAELRELSTVSSAELKEWMGATGMPLKEVLILDTCAAGAASDELLKLVAQRDVPPDQRRAVEFLKDATGTMILMGSAADKVSYEASKYGQGLLTYALLNGMHGRSIETDSTLNVSHWFQNASEDVPQLAQSLGGIQKPMIAARSLTGFPVARFNPADEAKVPLAAIKPELLHLTCHDDHDHDPLGLAIAVREQLREIGHPSVRGQDTDPPIVYLDELNDGPADSLTPKIVYSLRGTLVNLTLRIDQADTTLKEEQLSLDSADKNVLASAVAAKLVSMAGQIPPGHIRQ